MSEKMSEKFQLYSSFGTNLKCAQLEYFLDSVCNVNILLQKYIHSVVYKVCHIAIVLSLKVMFVQ